MNAKLLVVGGEISSGEYVLDLPTVIGRGHDAGLRLSHPLISRRHCEISEKDGLLYVRDLGSLNGTFIADNRVSEAVLRPDELMTIGPVILRAVYKDVHAEPSSDPDAPSETAALSAGNKTARTTKTIAPQSGVTSQSHSFASNRTTLSGDPDNTTVPTESLLTSDDIDSSEKKSVDNAADDDDKLNDFFNGLGIK